MRETSRDANIAARRRALNGYIKNRDNLLTVISELREDSTETIRMINTLSERITKLESRIDVHITSARSKLLMLERYIADLREKTKKQST